MVGLLDDARVQRYDKFRLGPKFKKYQHAPPRVLVDRSAAYLGSLVAAKLHLRGATSVGQRVRTIGKPRIENYGTLVIGDDTVLRSVNVPLELCVEVDATLIIGRECSLNYGVSIGTTERVTIGDRVRMGPYVMIVDNAFHSPYERSVRPPSKPVVIEDDVWLASRSSILPGVTIGRGVIVGAGSTVTRDVPPFTVVAGNPAREVDKLDPDLFREK